MQIHLAKVNYKDRDATINPRTRTTLQLTRRQHQAHSFKLFSKSTINQHQLACPYCLFRFCLSLRTTSSSSWRFS